jgi:hypothetical protein
MARGAAAPNARRSATIHGLYRKVPRELFADAANYARSPRSTGIVSSRKVHSTEENTFVIHPMGTDMMSCSLKMSGHASTCFSLRMMGFVADGFVGG